MKSVLCVCVWPTEWSQDYSEVDSYLKSCPLLQRLVSYVSQTRSVSPLQILLMYSTDISSLPSCEICSVLIWTLKANFVSTRKA